MEEKTGIDQETVHELMGKYRLFYADGPDQDYFKAFYYLRQAADGKLPEAQYELGHHLLFGKDMPCNKAKAALWLKKAADQGFVPAEKELATEIYQNSSSPFYDKHRASELLLDAARRDAENGVEGALDAEKQYSMEVQKHADNSRNISSQLTEVNDRDNASGNTVTADTVPLDLAEDNNIEEHTTESVGQSNVSADKLSASVPSIVSLVLCFIPYLRIVGIILAIYDLANARKDLGHSHKLSKVAIIVFIIMLLLEMIL